MYMFVYTYVYLSKFQVCAYMVRRLAFPAPPPPIAMVWSGTGWWGGWGGAGVCGEGWGCWSCSWRNGQASQTRPA